MQSATTFLTSAAALVLTLVSGGPAEAQGVSPARLSAVRANLDNVKTLLDQLPAQTRRGLSAGAQNLLQAAGQWDQFEASLGSAPARELQQKYLTAGASQAPSPGGVPVSNPATDFLFSVMTGFTQSETSTAWCGSNMAVGFNDSGSFFESLLFGPGGASFSGAAYSTNGGASFRDIGFVNPGPDPSNFLAGDPTLSCINSSTFYYSQIFLTGGFSSPPVTAIALSTSTDGGATWGDPVQAVGKDGRSHFLDKSWHAVDPSNLKNIFVTYTDFDFSGTSACGRTVRIAIELVRSTNGGQTWSSPMVIDAACQNYPFPYVQGSQVAVDSRGTVYVAYEAITSQVSPIAREMRIAKSTTHGASFRPPVKIDNITAVGDSFGLQGLLRNNEFPTLAIDRSGTATNGSLYVAWNDARYLRVPDQEGANGVYGYGDILLSRSSDEGNTWSTPVRVNTDPVALSNGRGTDQFQPGAAVDKTSAVAVCWYDRSRDPLNYLIGRACGVSRDTGSTWSNMLETTSTWPPIHATDAFINPYYLGDYDQLVSDFTKASSGFAGAYGNVTTWGVFVPNQDVFLTRIP